MFKYTILALLFVGFYASAGTITDSVPSGNGSFRTNFVKNSFCAKNALNTTATAITVAKDTDTDDKLNGVSSCLLTTTNATNVVYFDVNAITNDVLAGGNCQATLQFKGDGSTWTFGVDSGAAVSLASVALTNETGWRTAAVNYPCAASLRPYIKSSATSKTLNVGVDWGSATNLTSATPVTTWTSYTPTFTGFGTTANVAFQSRRNGPDLEVRGVLQSTTPTAVAAKITLGYAGTNANVTIGTSVSASGEICGSGAVSTVGAYNHNVVCAPSVNYFSFGNATATLAGFSATNGNAILASGDYFSFFAKVPIAGWESSQTAVMPNTPTSPTIQKFTTGSGTYTKPQSVKYIRVRMVGGGGGGSGGGAGGGNGGTGTDSTFGGTLLIAGAGIGGVDNERLGGAGGSWSLGTGAIGTGVTGGAGFAGATAAVASAYSSGGSGASSFFGGGGPGCGGTNVGAAAGGTANTGSGGGGGCTSGSANAFPGSGGGAGGFVDAIISNPSSTYAYVVGAGGSLGTAGTNGYIGGPGAAGYIEVTEYYNAENAPLLVGSVSTSGNLERVERARVTGHATTPTIASQSGSWITQVTRNNTGIYTLTVAGGIFSATPTCIISTNSGETTLTRYALHAWVNPTSATSIGTRTNYFDDSAASLSASSLEIDSSYDLICMGPR